MWLRVRDAYHALGELTPGAARCVCGVRVTYAPGPLIDVMPDADVTCAACRTKASVPPRAGTRLQNGRSDTNGDTNGSHPGASRYVRDGARLREIPW
jgi:hypothetical protein